LAEVSKTIAAVAVATAFRVLFLFTFFNLILDAPYIALPRKLNKRMTPEGRYPDLILGGNEREATILEIFTLGT
jgi:hypothetical protein